MEAVTSIPVFGNGDVRTIAEAEKMIQITGCHGIAIGRGALANPWFFHQLETWLKTGKPSAPGGYDQRLDVMRLHLRRLIDWQGDRYGCIQFRKVCTWYCKSLRAPHSVQQSLVMLENLEMFDRIANQLRDQGPPPDFTEHDPLGPKVQVPTGPIAHW